MKTKEINLACPYGTIISYRVCPLSSAVYFMYLCVCLFLFQPSGLQEAWPPAPEASCTLLPRAEPPQGLSTGLAQRSLKAAPLPERSTWPPGWWEPAAVTEHRWRNSLFWVGGTRCKHKARVCERNTCRDIRQANTLCSCIRTWDIHKQIK